MKKFIDWLGHIKGGYSLPKHLRYKLHNDWPLILKRVPRELNAFGPRSQKWWAKYRRYPILLLGYNCTRWMRWDDSVAYKYDYKGWQFLKLHPDCGPSPLQKLSTFSCQISWPLNFVTSYQFGKSVFLLRIGARWDSLDNYYNIGPYIGLAWN